MLPGLLRFSPKLAQNHFCCLLLVKALTEPTHFQETPPPGGKSFSVGREGRGNDGHLCREPSLSSSLLPAGLAGLRAYREHHASPVRCQQDVQALRSLTL